MEIIAYIIRFYDLLVINNLFIALLFIMLFSRFLSRETYTVSKNIARWLIIICAGAGLLDMILSIATNNPALPESATGPYWWAFWIIVFFSNIFPFVLLFKKLQNNGWAMLVIVLLMSFCRGINWHTFNSSSGSGWSVGVSVTYWVHLLGGGILAGLVLIGISITILKFRKTELTKNINSK